MIEQQQAVSAPRVLRHDVEHLDREVIGKCVDLRCVDLDCDPVLVVAARLAAYGQGKDNLAQRTPPSVRSRRRRKRAARLMHKPCPPVRSVSSRYVVLGCAHCYLAQVHRVVEWRAVTRSRSPSSTKNPPVPDTPRVAHAEIGRPTVPTVVAGRSLHLGLDHRVMGVSKGGGDGCCGDGGLSTKRDTTEARIRSTTTAPSCAESGLGGTPIHRTTGG